VIEKGDDVRFIGIRRIRNDDGSGRSGEE